MSQTLDLGAKENHEEGCEECAQRAVGQIVHAHNLSPFYSIWSVYANIKHGTNLR